MLYLNLFLNVLIKNPLRSISFFITGFALSLLLGQSDRIQNNILSSLPKMGEAPHFFALVDSKVNSESVRRKLMGLPGVSGVRNISGEKIENQLKEVLGDVGGNLINEITAPSVSGLKISFSPELEGRSQKLIKKYLSRLTGEDKVTMGPTIGAEKKTGKWLSSFKSSFKIKIGTIIVILASLLYLVFGIGLGGELGREAYLVERFSRRKNVIYVSAGLGFFVSAILMMTPAILLQNTNLVGMSIFAGVTLVSYLITTRRGWRAA